MADIIKKVGPAVQIVPTEQTITFSARELATEALDIIKKIMRGHDANGKAVPASLQMKAATEILNRAYGQAPIKVDATDGLDPEQKQRLALIIAKQLQQANPNNTDDE